MKERLKKDPRAQPSLFEMIAREWKVASPVTEIAFNRECSAVAFALQDGAIMLADTADAEAPEKRIRRAADDARLSILRRDKPFPMLRRADHSDGRSSGVVAHGEKNFAFAKVNGRINALTPKGTTLYLEARGDGPIAVITTSAVGKKLAFAQGDEVVVVEGGAVEDGASAAPVRLSVGQNATALAISPDGQTLAVGHAAGVSLYDLQLSEPTPRLVPTPGETASINWIADGRWLAVCLTEAGFCLIDPRTQTATMHGSFPAPVRSIAFNAMTRTIVASGAYRVAAWSLKDGPEKDGPQPVATTGKPGLVLVDAVACCPGRPLVAVGYANGLLSLAQIGSREEILLREDTGVGISAMAWSENGKFIAVASKDGGTALVELPDAMFKF